MLHAELSADDIDMRSLNAMDITAHMRLLFATARVNGDVRDALQCLRFDGYQTGLLCRRWHVGDASAFTPAQQRAKNEMKRHFNAIVESKEQGLQRLDPALYQMVASRAGLQPHEIIYVDTRKELLVRGRVEQVARIVQGTLARPLRRCQLSRAERFCTPPPRV